MTSNDTTPQSTRRKPQPAGLAVGIILLLIGVIAWINYVSATAGGFHTEQADLAYVVAGFLFWIIPWLVGTFAAIASARGWRKIVSLTVLPLGLVFLVVAIVTTMTGAEPPAPPDFPDVP